MDDFDAQRRRLTAFLGLLFTSEIISILLSLARPAVRLGAAGDGVPVRLGGAPLLPAAAAWPVWRGRPLDFLGAVDFAELAVFGTIPGLPRTGTAAFYYASETPRPWGDASGQRDGWRVFTGDLHPAEPPPGTVSYPPAELGAAPFLSLPSPQEPVMRRLERVHRGFLAEYEQLHAVWSRHVTPETPAHQLGGWPDLVQRPVGPDCLYASTGRPLETLDAPELSADDLAAADDWRLLLQLDSDDRLGWYWGDPGRVYFCSHRSAPLEGAWLTVQAT
ncbi:DUF1963 domain-containing protein [Actinomadura montaniterrae]|uniref:DUF1963 domain-containing protein n=1 Tax=Actinomadura montaniterrae TaxID=1803903 RepID=A0A6L3VXC6_9ACTN|nr:DUF1963 domain-containing protein [Actinomadura montaniterrae]KAB2384788.1 DUF1963 domain-containing protein [Actinomadura montaniterrae]